MQKKLKKYNHFFNFLYEYISGQFVTTLKVENLNGKEIYFTLIGDGGETHSKTFELLSQEVI